MIFINPGGNAPSAVRSYYKQFAVVIYIGWVFQYGTSFICTPI